MALRTFVTSKEMDKQITFFNKKGINLNISYHCRLAIEKRIKQIKKKLGFN